MYVIFLSCLIRCVLRSLKVNKLCKIAPPCTSAACLPTWCVYYFMAAIIMVITTYGTFICDITSHKTSATNIITIRRKMQTNGRHILHDKRDRWQKTDFFLKLIDCSVRTLRWMREKWENTIRNVGRGGGLQLCLRCDWKVITSLQTVFCVLTTNKLIE